MTTFNRRTLLVALGYAGTYAGLAGCQPLAGIEQHTSTELLSSIVYDLFPYPGLSAELYTRVADTIIMTDPIIASNGLNAIRSRIGNTDWSSLPDANRARILGTLSDSPFFSLVRNTAIETIYRDPGMFELIGYGGSAIEHGGYVNRGFDDINWL